MSRELFDRLCIRFPKTSKRKWDPRHRHKAEDGIGPQPEPSARYIVIAAMAEAL